MVPLAWFRAAAGKPLVHHLATAPIIMAAVDLSPDQEELADNLRLIVRRILEIEPRRAWRA
jgi:hypothetical protein